MYKIPICIIGNSRRVIADKTKGAGGTVNSKGFDNEEKLNNQGDVGIRQKPRGFLNRQETHLGSQRMLSCASIS